MSRVGDAIKGQNCGGASSDSSKSPQDFRKVPCSQGTLSFSRITESIVDFPARGYPAVMYQLGRDRHVKGHNVYSAALVPNQIAPYQVNPYRSSRPSQVQVVELVVSGAGCGYSKTWLVRRNGARSAESGSAEVATGGDDEESNFVIQTPTSTANGRNRR